MAHRLTTIRNADRIIVLSEGTIAEEGNHETLMTLKGLYYNLVTRQTNTIENEDDEEDDDDNSQVTQNVATVSQEYHSISLEHRDSTPEIGKVNLVSRFCTLFYKKVISGCGRTRKRR